LLGKLRFYVAGTCKFAWQIYLRPAKTTFDRIDPTYMDEDNFLVKSQLLLNLQDMAKLIDTGVFNAQVLRPFQEPVFISLIIKLNDLLQKLDKPDQRINFKDDISNGDITDLVNKIRNAICHLDSGENIIDKDLKIKFVFNVLFGKVNAVAIGNDIIAESDYNDDIAFYYGPHRIYLNRHIIRALKESQKKIDLIYPDKNPTPHVP